MLFRSYADMKSVTRSGPIPDTRSAAVIWRETGRLLDRLPRKPVRLIGAGIHSLNGDGERQMRFEDLMPELSEWQESLIRSGLEDLKRHYGLDFAANLDRRFHGETLYRTVEYMRRHR